ncbi:hypothetical protein LTR27_008663 [Elasticomyces elasticus]|nr:hypothetical protein LTR27_008663 [Elasticomyces elasticus]
MRTEDPLTWVDVQSDTKFLARQLPALSSLAVETKRHVEAGLIHPADALQQAAQKGAVPLDVIRVCLENYANRLSKANYQEPATMVREKPMAVTVLEQLWQHDHDWFRLVLVDLEATGWLCFLAVVEGLDDLVLTWVKTELPKALAVRTKREVENSLWRNMLFRNLIDATLSNIANQKADKALAIFFDMAEARSALLAEVPPARGMVPFERSSPRQEYMDKDTMEKLGMPSWARISLWPAACAITAKLTRGEFPRTTPTMFDRYLGYMIRYPHKGSPSQQEFTIARLYLEHPERPSAHDLYNFFRKRLHGRSDEEIQASLPRDEAGRSIWGQTLRNGIRVARLNHDYKNAAWLLGMYRNMPLLWPEHPGKFATDHEQVLKL